LINMSQTTASQTSPNALGLLDRLSSLFRTYAIPEGSILVKAPFSNDDRSCWTFHVPAEWTSDADGSSCVRVLEDGQHLGPAGVSHDDVRTLGRGRYSHWGDKLYFSSSDNSDPNTNGRSYSVVPPAGWTSDEPDGSWSRLPSQLSKGEQIEVEWTLEDVSPAQIRDADGGAFRIELRDRWPTDEDGLSTLLLLEDGKPLARPHASAADVASLGQGRYTHASDHVLFSTSDGSDPRQNQRHYQLAHAEAFVFAHALTPPSANEGHCWELVGLPASWPSDQDGGTSLVRVLEDGRLLGPHNAPHDGIRSTGGGGYSHWGDRLWFSTSDNSDPNTNGRTYTVVQLSDGAG